MSKYLKIIKANITAIINWLNLKEKSPTSKTDRSVNNNGRVNLPSKRVSI